MHAQTAQGRLKSDTSYDYQDVYIGHDYMHRAKSALQGLRASFVQD